MLLRDIDPDLDVACRTNVRVGLVPCGVNNSTIGEWNDSLYERTLRRIQEASKHGVVKGILWHQESPIVEMQVLRSIVICWVEL